MAAASAKTLTVDNPKPSEDRTIVFPKRRKQRRDFRKCVVSEIHKQDLVRAPSDTEIDSYREVKLMQKMQSCIKKLERSGFFREFLNQMLSIEMCSYFCKVIEPESKMPVVIYGIGSIESFESPCLQLGLAILLKKNFDWIGDIEVFDPIISLTESRILMNLGCSVLSINEECRRQVSRPTLFFMPHCDAELYDNLLQTNWNPDSLNKIVLFGNGFEEYETVRSFCHERMRSFGQNPIFADRRKHIPLADRLKRIAGIKKFTKEFAIDCVSDYYFEAFKGLSWHFFSLDSEAKLDTTVC